VLDPVFAEIEEVERQPIANLRMDGFGDADSARWRQGLEPRCDVYAVAHEIAFIDYDVAEIDADAKPHPIGLGELPIALVDLELDFGGAPHRLDRAGEFGNDTVACTSEDSSRVPGDQRINDLTVGPEGSEGTLLVLAYESTVADHIGRKDDSHS